MKLLGVRTPLPLPHNAHTHTSVLFILRLTLFTLFLWVLFLGTPCITDCVMAELEKLGSKFRVAQRIAKDPRFDRLPCTHKGTYADDCLVNRVTQVNQHLVYLSYDNSNFKVKGKKVKLGE